MCSIITSVENVKLELRGHYAGLNIRPDVVGSGQTVNFFERTIGILGTVKCDKRRTLSVSAVKWIAETKIRKSIAHLKMWPEQALIRR